MVKEEEETRKGPWTEQEDLQLVFSVRLFGERHWDFIAQVSGLNRTGKSCRLRWVNYLQPGLKRGRMSPDEERLVLELHSRWGNRWSRIARRLPGRTDNEIKNYWRTHMRKRAQERKRSSSSSSSSSSSAAASSSSSSSAAASSSSSSSTSLSTSPSPSLSSSSLLGEPPMTGPPLVTTPDEPHGGGGGLAVGGSSTVDGDDDQVVLNGYPMEQIWNEIESSEIINMSAPASCHRECCCKEEEASPSPSAPGGFSCVPPMLSPPWDYSWDSLWKMDDEEYKLFFPQLGHLQLQHGTDQEATT